MHKSVKIVSAIIAGTGIVPASNRPTGRAEKADKARAGALEGTLVRRWFDSTTRCPVKIVLVMMGPVAGYVAASEPINLGRLPQAAPALSSYGSSPQAVSPVPASITYRGRAR